MSRSLDSAYLVIDLFDFLNAKSYSFKISYILFIKLYILLYKIKQLNIYTHFTYKLLELFLVKTKIEGHDSSTNDLLLKTFQNNTFSVLELHEQFNRKNEIIEKRNRMQKIEWISEIELIIRGLHTQSASKANLKMTTLLNIIEYSIKHEKLSLGINGYSGLGLLVLSILDESYTKWDEILLLR